MNWEKDLMLKSLVLHIVTKLVCTDMIYILFWAKLGQTFCFLLGLGLHVFIVVLYLIRTSVYPCLAYACQHVCACVPWSHCSHTHMGLVKHHPNPERPESGERSLGLGPLQLAAGSHGSNNRVASQLQGTAMLFSHRSQIGGKWIIMGSKIQWMIIVLQPFK